MASGEKSHLVKRTGDSYVEIPLSDWSITEQATVAVLANGNVVSSDAGRECYVYSCTSICNNHPLLLQRYNIQFHYPDLGEHYNNTGNPAFGLEYY